MLYPFSRLKNDESQILFDGHPNAIDQTKDERVSQFIHGEAGSRLKEMAIDD